MAHIIVIGQGRNKRYKGDNHIPKEQKPLAGAGMGHIGKLVRGNPQLLRQNLPVSLGLVQHVDKIRVFKNILNLTGGQQVLHVLRQAAGYAAPFPEPFPDFHAETSGLAFQKEMEFVNIEPGRLMLGAVGRDTVPHGVLHNQKADLFQGLAQRL